MFGFHNSLHFTTFHPGRLVASPPNPWAFSHSRGSSTRPADRVQGSGTAAVEAMLGTVPKNAKARVAGKNIRRESRRRSERSKRKKLLSNFHLLKILCLNFPLLVPSHVSRFTPTNEQPEPFNVRDNGPFRRKMVQTKPHSVRSHVNWRGGYQEAHQGMASVGQPASEAYVFGVPIVQVPERGTKDLAQKLRRIC